MNISAPNANDQHQEVDGTTMVVGQQPNPAKYCSCDRKISYTLPGCFHPSITPFTLVESFCVFSNYSLPPLDTFVCEFMAYFFWSVNEMVAQHLTNVADLPGIPAYVHHTNINPALAPEELDCLQENFSKAMWLLQDKNAVFHSVAAELADVPDASSTVANSELNSEQEELLARRLVEATSDLVIAAFFTILARVYLGRRLVKPDSLESYDLKDDALVKMAGELLACKSHSERKAVFERHADEQMPSMLVKNVYDENVQEYLAALDSAADDGEKSALKLSCPLYIIPTVRRFFEDLVIHTIYLISSPDYLLSMCTIQSLHTAANTSTDKPNNIVLKPTCAKRRLDQTDDSDDTATSEKRSSDAKDQEASETTPLKWFVGAQAEKAEQSGCTTDTTDLLFRRGGEFEQFRKMITDLLDKL